MCSPGNDILIRMLRSEQRFSSLENGIYGISAAIRTQEPLRSTLVNHCASKLTPEHFSDNIPFRVMRTVSGRLFIYSCIFYLVCWSESARAEWVDSTPPPPFHPPRRETSASNKRSLAFPHHSLDSLDRDTKETCFYFHFSDNSVCKLYNWELRCATPILSAKILNIAPGRLFEEIL